MYQARTSLVRNIPVWYTVVYQARTRPGTRVDWGGTWGDWELNLNRNWNKKGRLGWYMKRLGANLKTSLVHEKAIGVVQGWYKSDWGGTQKGDWGGTNLLHKTIGG